MGARMDRVGRILASERPNARALRRVFNGESRLRHLRPQCVRVLPSPLRARLLSCSHQLRHECRNVLGGRLPSGKPEPEDLIGAEQRRLLGGGGQVALDDIPHYGQRTRHVEIVRDLRRERVEHRLIRLARRAPLMCGRAQPVERRGRRVHRFPGKAEPRAIVGAETEEAVCQRIVPLVDQALEPQEPARGLRHLAVVDLEERAVHPEVGETGAVAGFRLGDLVGVVDGRVILAAGVDVEERPQILDRHRRTFDMPAGEADSPGTRPFHLPLLILRAELPEREVGRVALFPEVDARAGPETRHVQSREVPVVAELRRVEVDAVARAIGKTLRLDALDEGDLLGDVIGRLAPDTRVQDVEPSQIVAERLGVELGDLPRGLPGSPRARFDLVLAGVRVRGEMAHVGDVHHVRDRVTGEGERAVQDVHEDVRAEVADVRVVVHRRPAAVESDLVSMERHELARASGPRVIESNGRRHGQQDTGRRAELAARNYSRPSAAVRSVSECEIMAAPNGTADRMETSDARRPRAGVTASAPAWRNLRVAHVWKQFGPAGGGAPWILRDVTLSFPAGSFTCIVGPSGSGKTTLLNLLAGFETPTHGLIALDDAPITGAGRERAMIFQDVANALFPWLSALENAEFGLRVQGIPRRESRARAAAELAAVGLDGHGAKFPYQLSGGMKQRVQIARALANDPAILLMDEPFAALDASPRRDLQDELVRLWEATRKTVVFITHDLIEALLLATHVVVLGALGAVRGEFRVPLAAPRSPAHPDVMALYNELQAILAAEVHRAKSGAGRGDEVDGRGPIRREERS